MTRLRLRVAAVLGVVLVLGFFAVSNFVPRDVRARSPLLPDDELRLGLDLRGGIHWVLGVQLGAAEQREIDYQRGELEGYLSEEEIPFDAVSVEGDRIRVEGDAAAREAARDWAGGDTFRLVSEDPLVFGLSDTWQQQVRENAMNQVLEVLRRRIDDPAQGIPESVVTKQGADRVLVQIPGGQIERHRAREILKVTGFLQFKMVEDEAASEELLLSGHGDRLPEGKSVVVERDRESDRVVSAYLVPKEPALTGDYLTDARVAFDNQRRPIVTFQFNAQGGEIFAALTGENIGNKLAIVLDDRVYSAPAIRSTIRSRGQIEGRFTMQEAADLAVVLRSGSLSVPVVIEEERTVGPALGQDSIDRGVRASILSLVLIVAFAVGYYRLSGVYAGVALLANLLLLIGLMSLFRSTLTLPGLAGVVLTVGMAVDANVIIFERIREELRSGKTVRGAVGTGFSKALWTILDANITTLLTAIVLYEYGTGPIKGFAVTLSVGVVTSVFSALVITRLLFALFPGSRPVPSLSI